MATSARLEELKKKFDESPRRYFAPLANEYRKLGDLPQAVAICRAHLPNQPGHVSGHIVLAQALYESGELAESRLSFESALDLDPENLIALRFLGDIAREQGDAPSARTWYERVLEADPRNDEISSLLAELNAVGAQQEATDFAEPDAAVPVESFMATAVAEPPAAPELLDAPLEEWSTPTPVDVAQVSAERSMPVTDRANAYEEAAPPPPALILDTASFEEIPGTFTIEAANAPSVPETAAPAEPVVAAELDPFEEAFAQPTSTTSRDVVVDAISLGDLEAVAEPSDDDWFHGAQDARPEPSAQPFEAGFFPDLSSVTPPASPVVPAPAFSLEEPAADAPPPAAEPSRDDEDVLPTFEIERESTDDELPTLSVGEEDALPALSIADPTPVATPAIEPEAEVRSEAPMLPSFPEFLEDSAASEADEAAMATAPTPISVEIVVTDETKTDAETPVSEEAVSEGATFEALPQLDEEDAAQPAFAEATVDEEPVSAVSAASDDSSRDEAEPEEAAPYLEWPAYEPYTPESEPEASVESGAQDVIADAGEPVVAEHEPEPAAPAAPVIGFAAPTIDPWAPTPPAGAFEVIPEPEPAVAASPVSEAEGEPVQDLEPESVEGIIEADVEASATVDDLEVPVAARDRDWEAYGDSPFGRTPALGNQAIEPAPAAFVTETMAELYLQQGFVDDALAIYRQLHAQSPSDDTLRRRIEALEAGANEAQQAATQARVDRGSQSARAFFSFFALREPRGRTQPDDRIPFADAESNAGDAASAHEPELPSVAAAAREEPAVANAAPVDATIGEDRFSAVATNEEALTVPDEAPLRVGSLETLFASSAVDLPDEAAAGTLASAFSPGAESAASAPAAPSPAPSSAQELSLQHLFRDVPSRSPGAVTLDEFFSGGSPTPASPPPSGAPTGQERADIEQFTAWLEGLKRK